MQHFQHLQHFVVWTGIKTQNNTVNIRNVRLDEPSDSSAYLPLDVP